MYAGGGAQVAQRSLVATLEITTAASVAHVLAGGTLPGAGFLFAFGVIVFACCAATIGRFLSVGVVVPVVLLAQVGLHAALDSAPLAHHGAGHQMPPSEGMLGSLSLTPLMFWAHLITAVVTAILLLLQERAVDAVAAIWRSVAVVPAELPSRRSVPATTSWAGVRRSRLLRLSPRRGPPLWATAT